MRKSTHGIIVVVGLALLAAGWLWLRGYQDRLRLEGALTEAMKTATARRTADSLALEAARDSMAMLAQALDRSATSVAASAGNWQSERASRPTVLESFRNPPQDEFANPAAAGSAPVSDTLASVMRYARRLEASGDSLARSCTSLRNDCEAFRAQAAVTMAAQDSLRADVQRQLEIAIAQRRTQPRAVSRWTRNAGLFLAGVGAGLVLERIR